MDTFEYATRIEVDSGQVDCLFCGKIIRVKAFKYTCGSCHNWLNGYTAEQQARFDAGLELDEGFTANAAGKVVWHEQVFVVGKKDEDGNVVIPGLLDMHKDAIRAERQAAAVVRVLTQDPEQESVPVELTHVDPLCRETYYLVKALYKTERLGIDRIWQRLRGMGYQISRPSVAKYLKLAKKERCDRKRKSSGSYG